MAPFNNDILLDFDYLCSNIKKEIILQDTVEIEENTVEELIFFSDDIEVGLETEVYSTTVTSFDNLQNDILLNSIVKIDSDHCYPKISNFTHSYNYKKNTESINKKNLHKNNNSTTNTNILINHITDYNETIPDLNITDKNYNLSSCATTVCENKFDHNLHKGNENIKQSKYYLSDLKKHDNLYFGNLETNLNETSLTNYDDIKMIDNFINEYFSLESVGSIESVDLNFYEIGSKNKCQSYPLTLKSSNLNKKNSSLIDANNTEENIFYDIFFKDFYLAQDIIAEQKNVENLIKNVKNHEYNFSINNFDKKNDKITKREFIIDNKKCVSNNSVENISFNNYLKKNLVKFDLNKDKVIKKTNKRKGRKRKLCNTELARLERNRLAARKCRLKQQYITECLESESLQLENEGDLLKAEIAKLQSQLSSLNNFITYHDSLITIDKQCIKILSNT